VLEQESAHGGAEFGVVPRLRDEPLHGAILHPSNDETVVRISGEDHTHGVRRELAHLPQKIDSGHGGHSMVGNDETDFRLLDPSEGFPRIRSGAKLIRFVAEKAAKGGKNGNLVVQANDDVIARKTGARGGWTHQFFFFSSSLPHSTVGCS